MTVRIIEESLLDQDVDVIVNAANGHLRHGGGLARAIADAAAPARDCESMIDYYLRVPGKKTNQALKYEFSTSKAWQAEQDAHPLIATGAVGVTGAGLLLQSAIIHAVGPIWGGGTYEEPKLLASAYYESINTAHKLGYKSIALPAISAGIFGVPIDVVADAAFRGVPWGGPTLNMDIRFCLTDPEHVKAFTRAFG